MTTETQVYIPHGGTFVQIDGAFGSKKFTAVVDKGKAITILTWNGEQLIGKKTFALGEMAEYDSYNLRYYGPIVSITEKTVTIEERFGNVGRKKKTHRLALYRFAWRNYKFDIDEVVAENAETSQYI